MEHQQKHINLSDYKPNAYEKEMASNSYLMSLVVIIIGLPLPIINLLASIFFFFSNNRSTYFVRWHCTQNLLSQLFLFFFNTIGFWWTVSIFILHNSAFSIAYFVYISFVICINLIEFIANIIAAIEVRNGRHAKWIFFGKLTDTFCKPQKTNQNIL